MVRSGLKQVCRTRNRAIVMLLALLTACSSGRRDAGDGGGIEADGGAGSAPSSCSPGVEVACMGTTELTCDEDGEVAGRRDCADEDLRCLPEVGCAACTPGSTDCDGADVGRCREDGSGYDVEQTCDTSTGEACSAGRCANLCAEAEANDSYIGCEYWPVVTSNSSVASEFRFAVVVANPQDVEADVTIERGGTMQASATVPPGGLESIELPWVEALKGQSQEERSSLVEGGSYHLTSSVPVTVYQLNPLDYRIDMDCAVEPPSDSPFDGKCFSYSNDASLLLPSHVLTGNYMVMSRPSDVTRREINLDDSVEYGGSPGFATIVGVEDGPVSVEVRASAHIEASSDGAVAAMAPGDTESFELGQGDALQLVTVTPEECPPGSPSESRAGGLITETYCEIGEDYDLTGTEIEASGKVAVVSGHNCTFVPFDKYACDHLEEQMFPLESWGKDFVLAASEPLRGEPNVVRIVSGRDGNSITFEPSSAHSDTTLDRGEWVEFETSEDFRVSGSEALMMAQFLVGQNYDGVPDAEANGDPSMSLAIPSEQFRDEYTFLTPDSYEQSFVNVISTVESQEVSLNDSNVSGWRPVGDTGFQTARVEVPTGTHKISSTNPFGIVVYGFGSYTSYMYPGGLDLEMINAPF